jgi:hypothetical protein
MRQQSQEILEQVQETILQHINTEIWNQSKSIEEQETAELQAFIANKEKGGE